MDLLMGRRGFRDFTGDRAQAAGSVQYALAQMRQAHADMVELEDRMEDGCGGELMTGDLQVAQDGDRHRAGVVLGGNRRAFP